MHSGAKLSQQDYPEVKGVKEDLRPPEAVGSKTAAPPSTAASASQATAPRDGVSAGRSASPSADKPQEANLGASTRSNPA
eukprot:3783686-Amphidinium_carterae.1